MIAFFLCWAPFHAQRLLYVYAKDSPNFSQINEWMYYIAGCFYYFSSTVNPILYNVMSAKYRLAFRETLCGFIPQSRSSVQRSWNETNAYEESLSRSRSARSANRSVRQVRNNVSQPGELNQNNEVAKKTDKIEVETENTNLIGKFKNDSKNSDSRVKNSNNVVVVITPAAKKHLTLSTKTSRWSKALLRVVRSKTTPNDTGKLSVENNSVEMREGLRQNFLVPNSHSRLQPSLSESGFQVENDFRRTCDSQDSSGEGESSI